MKPHLRVIGDVHDFRTGYLYLANQAEYSIQVGDLIDGLREPNYNYDWLNQTKLDPARHGFIGGNHDNYDNIGEAKHNLGDFGFREIPNVGTVFFVRGAFSIDHEFRKEFPYRTRDGQLRPRDFWKALEQLNSEQALAALKLYKEVKPDILISHECPLSVVGEVTSPTMAISYGYSDPIIKTDTNQLLQRMHDFHKPKYHLFGHYHKWLLKEICGTVFICCPIMGYVDFYDGQSTVFQKLEFVEPKHVGEV